MAERYPRTSKKAKSNGLNNRKRSSKVNEIDDNQTPTLNPSNADVILLTDETMDQNTTDVDELSHTMKINSSKLIKIEHHIDFLEESLKQHKIPKGLQLNKEYQVMGETQDFRTHIREILLNAETEITKAIISHYRQLHSAVSRKAISTINKLTDSTTTEQLEAKIIDLKPDEENLKQKLKNKRSKKLDNTITNVERGQTYAAKTREPRKDNHSNRQQSYHNYQRRTRSPRSYLNHQPSYRPPKDRFEYHPRRDYYPIQGMEELITRTVQNLLTEMLPHHYQQDDWRNPYY